MKNEKNIIQTNPKESMAIFAGGSFWCLQSDFKKLKGVKKTISGYIGGKEKTPSYDEVLSGKTNHCEAVKIIYDQAQTNYEKLLDFYFRHIDPTNHKGQFSDIGKQYRPIIFYIDETQKNLAELNIENLTKEKVFAKKIVVEVTLATEFFPAEKYHQDYDIKNPIKYGLYRRLSGRDKFLQMTRKEDKTKYIKTTIKNNNNTNDTENSNNSNNISNDNNRKTLQKQYILAQEN